MKGAFAPLESGASAVSSTVAEAGVRARAGALPRGCPSLDQRGRRARLDRVPELPEIAAYLHALEPRVVGARLEGIRVRSVALLRTWDPPLEAAAGKVVLGLRRLGKRIVLALEDDLFLALHLMVAGRLKWGPVPWSVPRKGGLAAFDFSTGSLLLVEAGTKRRARLHLLRGAEALAALDSGGIEVRDSDLAAFRSALLRERHTLKRTLTDPRLFSGIGGAFADEILHRARLSPLQINDNLSEEEHERLWSASRETLAEWIAIRIADAGEGFPEKLTPFHPRMARAREAWEALPGLRGARPAHRVRRPRDELLSRLPDRRADPRRPGAQPAPARRLATDAGGAGGSALSRVTSASERRRHRPLVASRPGEPRTKGLS